MLSLWDGLSPERRRIMAQFDASHDPANKVTAATAFEIEAEIQRWEAVATPTALDLGEQQRNLETLRRRSTDIDAGGIILAPDARATAGEASASPIEPAPTEGGAHDGADQNASYNSSASVPGVPPFTDTRIATPRAPVAAIEVQPNKRGRPPARKDAAIAVLIKAVSEGMISHERLATAKKKELPFLVLGIDGKETTLMAARHEAVAQLNARRASDKLAT